MTARVVLLSGGVGGARLARGFELLREAVELTVIVNVGDDFEHLGLHVSPDIDTVLYTLAGVANAKQGWGLENESWRTLSRLGELGGDTWFQLGDLDLATHLMRSGALAQGERLTEVTERLRTRLGVRARVLPVSDDRLRTVLHTDRGLLDFQHYFVRERCEPVVTGFTVRGGETATVSAELEALLVPDAALFDVVVLAPSNPFLSLAPLLAVQKLSERLRAVTRRVVAVSPIIGGEAVKGPAAKLMRELGLAVSSRGWANYLQSRYPGFIDEWVLDERDKAEAGALRGEGFRVTTTQTLMHDDTDREQLARVLLEPGNVGA